MEINSKSLLKNHSVSISGRDKIEVLGVSEIFSSTDKEIYAKLEDSVMLIVGEKMTITKLIPEEKLLSVSGIINGVNYVEKLTKKSFLGKVFK